MKVIIIDGIDEQDYRSWLVISVDGVEVASFSDGEPEDSNLSRDFSDCYRIGDLMKAAYEAGVRGDPFELEHHSAVEGETG